jgi:hypothetical protein
MLIKRFFSPKIIEPNNRLRKETLRSSYIAVVSSRLPKQNILGLKPRQAAHKVLKVCICTYRDAVLYGLFTRTGVASDTAQKI